MTTYNGARFVEEQLDSLFSQRRPPDEIVVADDCSSDGTFELLQSIAASAPVPLRCFRNSENLGWRANFLQVAGWCRGDVIAFCDQDDRWSPHKLERVAAVLGDPTVSMVHHNARLIDEQGGDLGVLFRHRARGARREPALRSNFWESVLGFSMAFRRELLRYNDYWPSSKDKLWPTEPAPHDQWFQFLASILGSVVYLDEQLVSYRLHRSNSTGLRSGRVTGRDVLAMHRMSHQKVAQRIEVVENRLEIIESILADGTGPQEPMQAALVAYREHLRLTRMRLAMYEDPQLTGRLRRTSALATTSEYHSRTLPLGAKEVVRDAIACLVGSSL